MRILVAYIPPHDVWYVIPPSEFRAKGIVLWPDARRPSRSQFDQYRSAWHILTGNPDDDDLELGLTIHAAADDGKKSKLP